MDIKTLIHPSTNFEIIKYYWPESLSGQANSAAGSFGQISDMHFKYTREDGTSSCSCGLVYWDSNIPLNSNPWGLSLDDFGHKDHVTGELEPHHKSRIKKFESPTEHIFQCEWCQTTSIMDGFFGKSNQHSCDLEDLPESRFIWITANLEVERKKFLLQAFDQHPEQLDFGLLEIKLGVEGAFIYSRSLGFEINLLKLLDQGQLLLSEELRNGYDDERGWPSEYLNPIEKDMDSFWETEKENQNNYLMDSPEAFGYFKFWNLPVEKHNLVRYTMTKKTFSINARRGNVPIMCIPVIGLT